MARSGGSLRGTEHGRILNEKDKRRVELAVAFFEKRPTARMTPASATSARIAEGRPRNFSGSCRASSR
eukprot:4607182-Pyramimonas_sp.AAC.1